MKKLILLIIMILGSAAVQAQDYVLAPQACTTRLFKRYMNITGLNPSSVFGGAGLAMVGLATLQTNGAILLWPAFAKLNEGRHASEERAYTLLRFASEFDFDPNARASNYKAGYGGPELGNIFAYDVNTKKETSELRQKAERYFEMDDFNDAILLHILHKMNISGRACPGGKKFLRMGQLSQRVLAELYMMGVPLKSEKSQAQRQFEKLQEKMELEEAATVGTTKVENIENAESTR